jgi:hypothetical protein
VGTAAGHAPGTALAPASPATSSAAAPSATATSAPPAGQDADWPTYDRTADRSGVSISSPASATPRRSWTTAVDGTVYAQPLVVGSEVIVATENDTVYALDESTGAVRWSRHLASPVPAGLPCGNVDPSGITGTPVADVTTGSDPGRDFSDCAKAAGFAAKGVLGAPHARSRHKRPLRHIWLRSPPLPLSATSRASQCPFHAEVAASRKLLITADAGGFNGYRLRLWKKELAALAEATGLAITVCHMPPGTSKWNRIEHRLFSHISMNWAGQPLTSHQVAVNLIAGTTTRTGLTVHAERDTGTYPRGIKIPDREMKLLASQYLHPHDWHGEWNYTITPSSRPG